MTELTCKNCNNKFIGQNKSYKYCKKCKYIELKCYCNKIFKRKRTYYDFHIKNGGKYCFCSIKCNTNFPLFKITTNKTKLKISKTLTGRKTNIIPKSAFKKGHTINNGRKHTIETRKKWSKIKPKGKNSPLWKGGITPLNLKIRKSLENKIWRIAVFERDNYTCQKCGIKSGNGIAVILEAHHIIPFKNIISENNIKTIEESYSCKDLWNTKNGITYCKRCHIENDIYRGKRGKNKNDKQKRTIKETK